MLTWFTCPTCVSGLSRDRFQHRESKLQYLDLRDNRLSDLHQLEYLKGHTVYVHHCSMLIDVVFIAAAQLLCLGTFLVSYVVYIHMHIIVVTVLSVLLLSFCVAFSCCLHRPLCFYPHRHRTACVHSARLTRDGGRRHVVRHHVSMMSTTNMISMMISMAAFLTNTICTHRTERLLKLRSLIRSRNSTIDSIGRADTEERDKDSRSSIDPMTGYHSKTRHSETRDQSSRASIY